MNKMIEIVDQLLAKCDSHVLTSETEDSLKKKKKQPEKANGHTLGTDPALRSDKEMVKVPNEEAWKSNKYKLDYDEDGMPQTPEAQKEFDERGRRNAAMHAGIKPKVPRGVKPRKGEEVERSMTSIIDDLMQKAVLSSEQRDDMSKKQFVFPGEKRYPIPDAVHGRNALARVAQHGTPAEKKKVRAAVHKKFPGIGDDDKKEKSMISMIDEIMEKARIRASKVRHIELSPEKKKEYIARADKKLHALNTAGYRPDYSRTAQKIYEEESKGEKSIDERTCDLFKDHNSRKEIADAVRAVRLHREGMHKEAKKINPNPERLVTAARKHNAMIASAYREKSILNTWKEDSSMMTKGSKMLPVGPGGEVQDLSKNGSGSTPPTYHETEKKQEDVMSGKKERERKAKKRIEYDKDIAAE